MKPDTTADSPTARADSAAAQQLWNELHRARPGGSAHALTEAEDALFRFYMPMAQAIAAPIAKATPDPFGAFQAAEAGLAEAILAWQRVRIAGFERFARATIISQVRYYERMLRAHPAATRPRVTRPSADLQPESPTGPDG